MARIYKFAALGTFGFLMFLWANQTFRWDALGIDGGNRSFEALVLGLITIWGGAAGWQWANSESSGLPAMPKWLGFTLTVILVMAASAAGRILFR